MNRRTASRTDTRRKFKYALLALIGLILWPLTVGAHTSSSPAGSVHPYVPFDYERWQRDHPLPASKRLARDVGEPRTVRMIYFLPNDRPYRQEVVDEMKAMIRRVQTFFADQMQAHGYGNTTFRFETDAQGEPLVHLVDGQHPESHYNDNDTKTEVNDEIYFGEGPLQFDISENDYLIVIDNSTGIINANGDMFGGLNSDYGKRGGITLVPSYLNFGIVAHELGHTFGLFHDFRDDAYIMSYGYDQRRALSACAAEFLSVHPYFNADISLGEKHTPNKGGFTGSPISVTPSTIEIISSPYYPAGSTSVSIRLKVSDAEGLHQVSLYDFTREPHSDAGQGGLRACRGLSGEKEAVVEFKYDVSIPPFGLGPSEIEIHSLWGYVVDAEGEKIQWNIDITEAAPYHAATFELGGWVNRLSFSPDGALLAVAVEGQIQLWNVARKQQITTFELGGWVNRLSFSPDGALLAVAVEGQIQLWNVARKQQITTFELGDSIGLLSFLPDGTLAAGGGEWNAEEWYEKFELWDVATRQHITTLAVNRSNFSSITVGSFSPDGALLAVAVEGQIQLWDVASRKQIETFKLGDQIRSLSFSPDGKLLASGTYDGSAKLWDVSRKETVATFEGGRSLSFSPDGALLAVAAEGQGQIQLWDVASRKQIETFVYPSFIRSLSFSPDGALLASGGQHNTVQLWDVSEWTGQQPITTVEQAMPHTLTKVSGDGQEGPAGTQLANPFVVSVLDQNGSPLAGAAVRFAVTAGGGALSSTTTTTDANGRARSTLTLGSDPGRNTVTATVEGLEPVTFTATAIEQKVHSLTKVSGDGQGGPASTQLAAPFVISVLDQDDSPLAGVDVTFAVTAGGGMLSATTNPCTVQRTTSSTTATTGANGQAAIRLTLGGEPGTNTVEATVEGLEPVTFTATSAEQAVPHRLAKVCGDSQEGIAGAILDKSFVVSVSAENGAAIAGVAVSFAVTAGGGTLSSATATTDANGRAATSLTLGSEAGANTVSATVEGLRSVTFTATGQEPPTSLFDMLLGGGKLASLPDSPQLEQNAPNPFNSQTVLSYFLPEPSPMRLEVFALTGQRVAVLQQGPQQAGYHRLHWDGRDDAGRPVASGMYLYRLVTDETVLTRKLILLR